MLRGVKNSDIENLYKLLCENNKIYDEFLEKNILPRNFATLDSFSTLIKDGHTRAILIENTEKSPVGIEYRKLEGFLIFRIEESNFKILIIELAELNNTILKGLVKYVVDKSDNTKDSAIYLNLLESRLNYCKPICDLGFTSKVIRNTNFPSEPDIIKLYRKGKL